VIAEATRRSALADYADRFAAISAASRGDLTIRELPFLSQVNFRADPSDASMMQRLATSLGGLALPTVPNTVTSRGDRRALWLGPDEWLLVGPEGKQASFEGALRVGLAGAFGSIVDVSANRTVLKIRGAKARDLLLHGVPIDLDERAFGQGHCAQTLLAKAQVIIERSGDELAFNLYVRSSFACYVADWLLDAASDPSIRSSR
jgi:sarcosine oxidase, subunit gamma